MQETRLLNDEEKCELISALANARINNNKKAKNFKGAAEPLQDREGGFTTRLWRMHHPEDRTDLSATAERFGMWAQLDESLIEAIRSGDLVMVCDEEGEGE